MKIIYTLLLVTLLISCSESTLENEAHANTVKQAAIINISAPEFKQLVDKGEGIILDVRTPEEQKEGTINNASTIDIYDKEFEEKINLIPKDKEIYVYCKVGGRSAQAAKLLEKNGFSKVYNLNNGIMEWENEGYPIANASSEKDEKIQEVSLADFQTLIASEKPVLIDFHTVWCGPCRKMAPIVDKIEEEYKEKATVVRIDIDKSKELAKNYNIKGVPVFVLYKNGEEKWKYNGMIAENEITQQIEINL